MAELLLGPLLRHVGERDATVWVETDRECEVEVLGSAARTFCVAGHHYAIVCIDGLDPKSRTSYDVKLDGEARWPEDGSDLPPPVINTVDPDRPLRILYGSCRVSLPHEPPYTLDKDDDERGRGHDALWVLAQEMLAGADHHWPDILMLLGDQVYADEVSPGTLARIRASRDTSDPPGEEVANYEEYTWLYRESWSDPLIRWLLSTVPSAMVIDDHDMHDDWNISRSWVRDAHELDWWEERVVGGLASYWVYQHLGNLSPRSLAENDLYRRIREADDGFEELRQFAEHDDRRHEGVRWCYCRELGRTKLIVIDDRTGRVLGDDERKIAGDEEWDWIVGETEDELDHLVIGVSDPALLSPGLHHLEAWNEAVCDGAWGGLAAKAGERIRRAADFDHWGAFGDSFNRLADLLREIGSRESAPASITILSGDVHHAYLAEVGFPNGSGVRSAVTQAVCSPFRNELDSRERAAMRTLLSKPAEALARALARAAGVADPPIRWRFVEGPYFDNQAGTLILEGRQATAVLDKTIRDDSATGGARLERVYERRLA
jgi:PhoD-like phosphatase